MSPHAATASSLSLSSVSDLVRAADATASALAQLEAASPAASLFEVASWEVDTRADRQHAPRSTAAVTLRIGGHAYAGQSTRPIPLEALDAALRTALGGVYAGITEPVLTALHLDGDTLYAAWSDATRTWAVAAQAANPDEAAWLAVCTAVRYELLRAGAEHHILLPLADELWAI